MNSIEFIANLTFSFTSSVSLWDRPCYQNMLIYDRENKLPKTYDNIKLDYLWLICLENLEKLIKHKNALKIFVKQNQNIEMSM